MTSPVVQKKNTNNKTRVLVISLFSVIIISLIVFSFFAFSILSHNKVYSGVYINDIDVSNLSYDQVYELLKSSYTDKAKDVKLTLKHNEVNQQIDLNQLKVSYDIEGAARKAYDIGRTGNIFNRLYAVFSSNRNGSKIELQYSYDEKSLKDVVDNFYSRSIVYVKEADLFVSDKKVTLRTGHPGEAIDRQKVSEIMQNSIKTCTGGTFDVPVKQTMPSSINVDEIYNQINQEVKDASVTVEDNKIKVLPHSVGRKIDKAELINIIKEHEKTLDTEKELPVVFTEPKIKTEDISAYLFRDVLASASTRFSTANQNDANRGVNIRLASSKINGKVLGPGEVFSFNEVVGPRTKDGGYQVAHVYVRGKIIDDVGGGICQVSTTLYNAVLFADLQTVERRNHMFTVGYVPYGRDAAVSYNEVDYKFKNNTNWPIKIEASVSKDNKLTFRIIGTNENPDKSIEISHVQISATPAPVKYIDDPNLEEGKTVVLQKGMAGYVIDTYKIVKVGDKVISKTKLHRSTYNPYARQIKRGTKKVQSIKPTTNLQEIIKETPNIN